MGRRGAAAARLIALLLPVSALLLFFLFSPCHAGGLPDLPASFANGDEELSVEQLWRELRLRGQAASAEEDPKQGERKQARSEAAPPASFDGGDGAEKRDGRRGEDVSEAHDTERRHLAEYPKDQATKLDEGIDAGSEGDDLGQGEDGQHGGQAKKEDDKAELFDVSILVGVSGNDPLVIRNCINSLRNNLPSPTDSQVSWEIIVVQVGEGVGQRETVLVALDEAWLQMADNDLIDRLQFLQESGKNLSHAFNLAASRAQGRYLLFFLEAMEMPPPSAFTYPNQVETIFEYLISVVEDDQAPVGVVGAKVIYGGEDAVYHAGIGWLNSRYPHEHSPWGDEADAIGNVALPYHQFQGLSRLNKQVNNVWNEERELTGEWPLDMKEQINTVNEKGTSVKKRKREIEAVGVEGMFTPRRLFLSLGGFHIHRFAEQYFDIDYCLRVGGLVPPSATVPPPPSSINTRVVGLSQPSPPAEPPTGPSTFGSSKTGLHVIYDPHVVFYVYDTGVHQEALDPQSRDATAFAAKWNAHPTVKSYVNRKKNGGLANTTVVWNMECGLGQVLGFTVEGINFILGLDELVYVVAEPTSPEACYSDLQKAGFPPSKLAVFRAAFNRRADAPQEKDNDIFVILHRDPGRYSMHLFNVRGIEAHYVIGRSMFETNSIPSPWISATGQVDEIWVPSKFNIETFASAGVPRKKLVAVGESLDPTVFDPESVQRPLPLPGKAKFNFLTNGKWEKRKGWDVLLKAYYEEFKKTEDVALHFVARLNDAARLEFSNFQLDMSKQLNLPINKLPRVQFASEIVPFALMPALYKSADAFVLPTHGEGWGLPLMEAMAMGIPTIATNWSGNTEFMNSDNGFGISVEGLVPSTTEGHLWAQPSHTHLRHLMRKIYDARTTAKKTSEAERIEEIVRQARQDVVSQWSLQGVARRAVERLSEIKSSGLLAEAKTKHAAPFSNRYSSGYNANANNNNNLGSFAGSAYSSLLNNNMQVDANGRRKIKIVNDL